MKCVALLRGINVSGRKSLKKANVKKAFESPSFKHVQTYVQRGNVIFDCEPTETAKMSERIENRLREDLGANVIVRTKHKMERIVKNNPLAY